ncbi:MAG: tetratricopeptide repeat protein [Gammaproteobacteria bacterium]|nr:tetratricopeptide repeat protein [Gammaproteobacteria bacterium]
MTNKQKIVLGSTATIVLILSGLLWFFVLQPDQSAKWDTLLQTGITSFNNKQYQEALKSLEQIPSDVPQGAKARYFQGSAHLMLKDLESAVIYLEQALAIDSHDTGAMYALGVAYYKMGNIKLAKSHFASVLKLNPNDEQAKGLLDIMARLERYAAENQGDVPAKAGNPHQPGHQSEKTSAANDNNSKAH